MKIHLGENIKKLRNERNISQQTLADLLSVSFQSVSRWERGDGFPDITLLPSLASFFEISVDELLGVCEINNEQQIKNLIEMYDSMKLSDISSVLNEYQKAIKQFPSDFRIAVRYMQLLHEGKIRPLSLQQILSGEYEKVSQQINRIYERIQNHCTDDSIRIWSKSIMISHLMWKYDCVCDEQGRYSSVEEYINQAKEIVNTLPSIRDSKEKTAIDREDYYGTHKTALEELLFLTSNELYGYCFNSSVPDRIKQFQCLTGLFELIYPDSDYGKNCYNRLYALGHLGHLHHQNGNDEEAMDYLKQAAIYAKHLDENSDTSETAKRYYNYGTVYRESSAAEFMKIVMTEHYPLSDEFKSTEKFRKIVELLSEV